MDMCKSKRPSELGFPRLGAMVALFVALLVYIPAVAVVSARKVLMVGGNFSLNGKQRNLAFYDLTVGRWTNNDGKSVFLYGQSNGALLDIAVDRYNDDDDDSDDSIAGWAGDTAYIVGTFDADSLNSQTALCSVAQWSGRGFAKVGEGLCPRGMESSSVTSIRKVILDDQENMYVGGSFHARVWNGPAMSFVDVFDLAHYSVEAGWLPLSGNSKLMCLQSPDCDAGVYALAWDDTASVLYVGGVFDSLNNAPFTQGIAQWRRSPSGSPNNDPSRPNASSSGTMEGSSGLEVFPGGGVSVSGADYSQVVALAFDRASESLFVSGRFDRVGDTVCSNIAVWQRPTNSWLCLHEAAKSFATVHTMMLDLDLEYLYLAGVVSDSSDWTRISRNAVARLPLAIVDAQYDSVPVNRERDRPEVVYEKGRRGGNRRRRLRTGFDSRGDNSSHPPRVSGGSDEYYIVRGVKVPRHRALANRRTPQNPPSPAPTPAPTKPAIRWEWLPGFAGASGPIFSLCALPGTSALFIGGSFNGLSSVLVWFGSNSSANPISSNKNIFGFVSSLAVANILENSPVAPPVSPDTKPLSVAHRLGAGIIGGLIFVLAIGGAFAMGFNTKMEYDQIASSPRAGEDDDDDGEYAAGDIGSDITAITLDTLSGGGRSSIDIHECLENAMRLRRLKFHETLSIIDSAEITLTGIIGEGSYGRVWAARWRNNTVAVKEFVFAQAALMGGSLQTRELIEEIVGEAGIMSLLNHPKILQLYGVSLTTQTIWIVSELCTLGSLRSLLSNRSFPLDLTVKLSLCMDIADGMRYLHTRRPPIIHRDLKSQNIFIVDAGAGRLVAKIGDWGSARAIELSGGGFQHMTQGIGTTCWLAPEVIENAHASLASDVYAFGIVLWEIVTRNEVYEGLTAAQIIARVVKSGLRPVAPPDCPLSDLMQACWAQDPSDRPSFKEILKILTSEYETASKEQSRPNTKT